LNINVPSDLYTLEELVDLFVAQSLAQRGQDVAELTNTDVSAPLLVENLETSDKVLC
jgi:hypothetical protein